MSQVFPELMCPFGQLNEAKYREACKIGKIVRSGGAEDPELMAGLVKAHYINTPMIATCCGVSACYACIKDVIAEQLRDKSLLKKTVEPDAKLEIKIQIKEEESKEDAVLEDSKEATAHKLQEEQKTVLPQGI